MTGFELEFSEPPLKERRAVPGVVLVVREQINRIEQTRLERLEKEQEIGVETADLLVQEVLSRNLHGWKREREKAIFCRGGCGLDEIV
jgi:hypothetical protein